MYTIARSTAIVALILFGLAACSSSNNQEPVTGKGAIRALHAIPNIGSVDFLIEETLLGAVGFKDATGISEFDDLEYAFSFEIDLPGDDADDPTVLSTRTLKVTTEQEYTFVLTGSLDDPQLLLWEQFGKNWADEVATANDNDTEVTVMEVSFGHVSSAVGAVDIYLEKPGTSPVFAVPKASVSFSDFQTATELLADEYQLIVTPAGDPETILFASHGFEFSPATSMLITLMDDGGVTTAKFSVSLIGAGSGNDLVDINSSSVISAVHAALGTDPLDLYDSSDFTLPMIDNLDFGSLSDETDVDDGELNMVVTPADSLGVFLSQRSINAFSGSYNRLYFVGLPGDLQIAAQRYDRSTLATHARFQLFQGAARFQTLDVYLVDLETDIQLIGPTFSNILYGTGVSYVNRESGTYNVFIAEPGTKNVVAGPLQVILEKNRNYSLTVVDSTNIAVADLLFFDDTAQP